MTYFNTEIWNFNLNLYFVASEYQFINSLRNCLFWWCFWLTPSQINLSPKKHPFGTCPRDVNSLVSLSRYLPHPSCFPSYTGVFQQSWFRLQVSTEPHFIQVSNTFHFAARVEDALLTILQQHCPASPSHLSIASFMSKETTDFDAAHRGRSWAATLMAAKPKPCTGTAPSPV